MPGPIKLKIRSCEGDIADQLAITRNALKTVIEQLIFARDQGDLRIAELTLENVVRSSKNEGLELFRGKRLSSWIFHFAFILGVASPQNVKTEIDKIFSEVEKFTQNTILGIGYEDKRFQAAVALQLTFYALIERFQNEPDQLRVFADSLIEKFQKDPVLYFPALTVLMDARKSGSARSALEDKEGINTGIPIGKVQREISVFTFTKADCDKISPVLKTFINDKNFPYVREGDASIHFEHDFRTGGFTDIPSYLQQIKSSNDAFDEASHEKKRKTVRQLAGKWIADRPKAFNTALIGSVIALFAGLLLMYLLPPEIGFIIRLALVIPAAVVLGITFVVGVVFEVRRQLGFTDPGKITIEPLEPTHRPDNLPTQNQYVPNAEVSKLFEALRGEALLPTPLPLPLPGGGIHGSPVGSQQEISPSDTKNSDAKKSQQGPPLQLGK